MEFKETWIRIRKEEFKFSSAHMTVYPDGTKEALHGHNYSLGISIKLDSSAFDKMVPMSAFKAGLRALCEVWDEKVLLPKICPFLTIVSQSKSELEFTLCEKRYVFPKDEIEFLNIPSITVELLSQEILRELLKRYQDLRILDSISAIKAEIEETSGQGALSLWERS